MAAFAGGNAERSALRQLVRPARSERRGRPELHGRQFHPELLPALGADLAGQRRDLAGR